MALSWLTSEHVAVISAAATAGVFGGATWVVGRMSRGDDIRKRLGEVGGRFDEVPLPNGRDSEPVRRYLVLLRERQDLLVELAHCEVEESRLQAEFNRRLFRWCGTIGGILTGAVVLAGGMIQLWEHFAS